MAQDAAAKKHLSGKWAYAAALAALWLALSGMYSPFFLGLGGLSVAVALYVSRAVGNHGHAIAAPMKKTLDGIAYAGWLEWEIIVSALKVAGVILRGKPLSPGAFWTPLNDLGEAGAAIYANSITLTPGTATIYIDEENGRLLVHALTDDDAAGVQSGNMHDKIRQWLLPQEIGKGGA